MAPWLIRPSGQLSIVTPNLRKELSIRKERPIDRVNTKVKVAYFKKEGERYSFRISRIYICVFGEQSGESQLRRQVS